VLYWVPVIAPGSLMFYSGSQTFPQWNGNGFAGLAIKSLTSAFAPSGIVPVIWR
jgi:aldose sugar dehydrogenase